MSLLELDPRAGESSAREPQEDQEAWRLEQSGAEETLAALAGRLRERGGIELLGAYRFADAAELRLAADLDADDWRAACLSVAREADRAGECVTRLLPGGGGPGDSAGGAIVATPAGASPHEGLVARIEGPRLAPFTRMALEWAAAQWATWRMAGELRTTRALTDDVAALLELVSRIESSPSLSEAGALVVDQLAPLLEAEFVALGVCRGQRLTSLAFSDSPAVDPRSERARRVQFALEESIARSELSSWPPLDCGARESLLALRHAATAEGWSQVIAAPLIDEQGVVRGAWLIAGGAGWTDERRLGFLRAAAAPCASALHAVARSERGPWSRGLAETRRWLGERRGRAVMGLIASLLLLACVPGPLRIRCDCRLEPQTRRFIAAPFDGRLEQALVEPGDVVSADELLARLDGRELRFELAGTRAELQRAVKERTKHLANHDSGKAELARHEVERLEMRTRLLEQRDRQLEIRSPMDGVVVAGDLEDAEGMPFETGETLFEIAPLEGMVVEVAVPELDYHLVRPGMPVAVALDSLPGRTFRATLERLQPRAELRDDENVFIAEVRLDNTEAALRPGMRGRARIAAGRAPWGWTLRRRPAAAALAWLGW